MADTKMLNIVDLNEFQRYILETNLVDLFNSTTVNFQEGSKNYDMWLDLSDKEGIINIYIQEVNYNGQLN